MGHKCAHFPQNINVLSLSVALNLINVLCPAINCFYCSYFIVRYNYLSLCYDHIFLSAVSCAFFFFFGYNRIFRKSYYQCIDTLESSVKLISGLQTIITNRFNM